MSGGSKWENEQRFRCREGPLQASLLAGEVLEVPATRYTLQQDRERCGLSVGPSIVLGDLNSMITSQNLDSDRHHVLLAHLGCHLVPSVKVIATYLST